MFILANLIRGLVIFALLTIPFTLLVVWIATHITYFFASLAGLDMSLDLLWKVGIITAGLLSTFSGITFKYTKKESR
jgi:hypothetical protein